MSLVNILKEYKSDKDITVIYIGRREGKLHIEDDYELVYFICPECKEPMYALKFPVREFMKEKYGSKYVHASYDSDNKLCSKCGTGPYLLGFEKGFNYHLDAGRNIAERSDVEGITSQTNLDKIAELTDGYMMRLVIPKCDLKNSLLSTYLKSRVH